LLPNSRAIHAIGMQRGGAFGASVPDVRTSTLGVGSNCAREGALAG
jgi:hypothetical protein